MLSNACTVKCNQLASTASGTTTQLSTFPSISSLQIVEEWEPLEYQRHIDSVEAALTAAVQDAIGETRTAGRAAFAAYAANMPERANALLRRMDSGLQQKLTTAVAQYAAGANLMAGEGKWSCRRMHLHAVCITGDQ
jgi:hypothetical protein